MLSVETLIRGLEYNLNAVFNLKRSFEEQGETDIAEQFDTVASYISQAIEALRQIEL